MEILKNLYRKQNVPNQEFVSNRKNIVGDTP